MSTVLINNVAFNLDSYFLIDGGITISMIDTAIEKIEKAVNSGDGKIEIGMDFVGYGYSKIISINKTYTDKELYTLVLKQPTLEETVARHTDDISIINGAIEELASIIGGGN